MSQTEFITDGNMVDGLNHKLEQKGVKDFIFHS